MRKSFYFTEFVSHFFRIFVQFLGFILIFLYIRSIFGQTDPSLSWKKIKTPHFELIYAAHHSALANFYAARLEYSYARLKPLWPSLPEITTVVLNDKTDLTNGYATAIPYPLVMIYPVLPGPMESIGEYGDWASELFIHEFTHILSFEQRRGAVEFLSNIFGSIMTPNMLLPRWWLEGVAVDAETRLSNHGRLRSVFQEATLRGLVLDNRWKDFKYSEANEFSIPNWPYGGRPYFVGSLLWSEMISIYGDKLIGEMHHKYGGRIPYALQSPLEEKIGVGFQDLHAKMKASAEAGVKTQLEILKKVPPTETKYLFTNEKGVTETEFLENSAPSISPDGLKMVFFAKADDLKRTVQLWIRPDTNVPFGPQHARKNFAGELESETPSTSPRIPRIHDSHESHDSHETPTGSTIQRVSWSPDSKYFVYDQVNELSPFVEVSDLWQYDLKTGKGTRITKGLRAREPDISPDGKKIVFVKLDANKTHLAVWNVDEKKETIFWSGDFHDRASFPLWLDDNTILFSYRKNGEETLWVRESAGYSGGNVYQVLPDFPLSRFATRLKETNERGLLIAGNMVYGRVAAEPRHVNQIFFTSAKNGVANLYSAKVNIANSSQAKNGSKVSLTDVTPITHSLTGVFVSDFDPYSKEFYITEMRAIGMHIRRFSASQTVNQPLPKISKFWENRYPTSETAPEIKTTELESEDYSASKYMVPKYWIPFFYVDELGTKVSATTSTQDPLGKHAYSLAGLYDVGNQLSSGSISYENKTMYPTLRFGVFDLNSPLANSKEYQRATGFQGSMLWPFLAGKSDWSLVFGANYTQRTQSTFSAKQYGPTLGVAYKNFSQSGAQISPEAGGAGLFSVTQYQPTADWTGYNQASLGFSKYFSSWLPKHHVFYFRFLGQYIDHDITATRSNLELSTSSSAYLSTSSGYLMRGYLPGAFWGQSLANVNLEYRFPIWNIYRGPTAPIFFQRLSGAVVADGMWFDGYFYDTKATPYSYRRIKNLRPFWNVGVEGKLETNIGYHFPIALISGYYWAFDKDTTEVAIRAGFGISM